jgi:hypothetical protein
LSEIKAVWYERFGDCARLAFACFQCDFLREHNVTYRHRADRHKAQSLAPATSLVDLAYVHRGSSMDSVSPLGVAADNFKISFAGKLLALCWRQPFAQEQQ